MPIKPILTFLFIITIATQAFSQIPTAENINLKGTVLDKDTNTPLSFVSIGLLNKPSGTVSDSIGYFIFSIAQNNFTDSLQISVVGYSTLRISVRDFISRKDRTILLQQKPQLLQELTVTNSIQRKNTETIGRQNVSKLVQLSVHNKKTVAETVGSEIGMRYSTHQKNAIIKDFNFYISINNFNFIRFRVNIYSVRDDMPDTLICERQIFAKIEKFQTGWMKLDLENYSVRVDEDFIITLQWIDSRMEKKDNPLTILPVELTFFTKNCYARIASQDKWKRMGLKLSNFVTLAY